GLKYVDLPIPELYDVGADPAEATNLAASRATDLERLRAVLAGIRAHERPVRRADEDVATLERLRALGYEADGGPSRAKERYTDADDPKRLIALDTQASEVLRLYYAGDLAAAVDLCRDLIRRRPDMPIAALPLAFLERARGDLPAAVAALRRAVALRRGDSERVGVLGAYLRAAGRP